ncbi:nucleobindin-2 [Toxorhynchites rutilus septentrionalis]|uniref:nucleobindin-2 n=1 Tax=Toxorhynchites rutilus septentrionalis TaxID=329112 RepID=UPI002478B323|nr:nucleobindin-2 [Toxorhynchites rutilus septentrionalis]XP_055622757.1 nucleobindin-2 [Toxorhynchites rutilus septentrionalis]
MIGTSSFRLIGTLFLFGIILEYTFGLPVVTQKPPKDEKKEEEVKDSNVEQLENVIEYNKYLQEVVKVLESDPVFREKLDKMAESDIRSGKIAQELEYVNHNVRSRLDELKRIELQRLRELATRQFELTNDIDREHLKIAEHVDHDNQHTFEIEDLKKLILKTSQDLSENDRRRREEFKQYELQKEFEKQEQMRHMDEEHRKKFEEDLKNKQDKHDKHEKIHHPGNKAHLEEVWEKQDHMDNQEFDPKTFFMLHDIDGNGFWDENEVKVLFINELNKMYQAGEPEDDMKERAEEMERMREHVFQEADTNKDGLISYEEFIEQSKREEFQKDPEWNTVDHQQQFTHEEYLAFERRNQEQIQRLIAEGKLPPHPNMPQGYYPGPNAAPYQVHPNQIPQQHGQYQQGAPQQVNLHPNQVYQHQPDPNYPQHSGQQSNMYQHPPQPNNRHPAQPQYQQQMQHPPQPQYQQQMQHPPQPQYQQQMQHPPQPQYQQVQHPPQVQQYQQQQPQNPPRPQNPNPQQVQNPSRLQNPNPQQQAQYQPVQRNVASNGQPIANAAPATNQKAQQAPPVLPQQQVDSQASAPQTPPKQTQQDVPNSNPPVQPSVQQQQQQQQPSVQQ